MGGVFDTIAAALGGQTPAAAPAKPPSASRRGAAPDMSALADARNHEMCAQGQNPQDYGINYSCTPGTTSGLDAAMQKHADKLHPVGRR